jgi:NTE family protein
MTRALVLGGGGPVGIAWESGLLAGLAEDGADLSTADFIAGTSAGSFVGAQLALGHAPADLAAPFLKDSEQSYPKFSAQAALPDLSGLLMKMMELFSGARPAQVVRAEIGAWALAAPTIIEDEFIARFSPALDGQSDGPWPRRSYACTAVDAADGSFHLWTKASGIGLARAIASSCAVPGVYPPISFQGHRYIDGGMKSPTNADVAKGHALVVVVSVTSGAALPAAAAPFLRMFEREVQELRDSGSRVEVIAPDALSAESFGPNLMDASRRPAAAESGLRQGKMEAGRIRKFWAAV